MDSEEQRMLTEIKAELEAIHRTVKGDPYSDAPGVLQRLSRAEGQLEALELVEVKRSAWTKGAVAVISSTFFVSVVGLVVQLFGGSP